MSPLFSLPNELIDAIVSATDDRPSLVAFAQTCTKLQPFAEAKLFKNIYIRDGSSIFRLVRDLDQPPWRAKAVAHLEVTPNLYSWDGIDLVPELIEQLSKLKSLKVESPFIGLASQPHWWSDWMIVKFLDLFARNGVFEFLTSCRLTAAFPMSTRANLGHLYH